MTVQLTQHVVLAHRGDKDKDAGLLDQLEAVGRGSRVPGRRWRWELEACLRRFCTSPRPNARIPVRRERPPRAPSQGAEGTTSKDARGLAVLVTLRLHPGRTGDTELDVQLRIRKGCASGTEATIKLP